MRREVNFYKTVTRKCPVEEYLDSLPGKVAQKITWVLKLLEDLKVIPAVYFSKMSGTDNIWECRVKLGSNIYRIFAFLDGNRIVLTHGIVKKTRKIPKREIAKAEMYKKDYFKRFRRLK